MKLKDMIVATALAGLVGFSIPSASSATGTGVESHLSGPLSMHSSNRLFELVGPPDIGTPPPGVLFTFPVTLDFEVMSRVPEDIAIEVPNPLLPIGIELIEIPRTSFEMIDGYIEDTSVPGCQTTDSCPLIPDPDASPEEFSFIWYGRLDAKVLSLTWRYGQFVGYFQYEHGHYRIYGDSLTQVDSSYFFNQLADDTADAFANPMPKAENVASKGTSGTFNAIDTLVLYSEGARTSPNHNGDPMDCNDDESITTLISAAVTHSNGSHMASGPDGSNGTGTQHGEVYYRRLTGLPTDADGSSAWETETEAFFDIVDNSAIEAERQELGADIVVVVLADGDFDIAFPDFSYCGFADIPNTADSNDPQNWGAAKAIVRENCQRQIPYIFTHEVGHLLGAQHALSQSPDQDPLFPWAHGLHVDSVVDTIMSTDRFGPRVDWFSTPSKTYDGTATGTVENEDVAFMISDTMGATVADYFPTLDTIFESGFQSQGGSECPDTVDWNG